MAVKSCVHCFSKSLKLNCPSGVNPQRKSYTREQQSIARTYFTAKLQKALISKKCKNRTSSKHFYFSRQPSCLSLSLSVTQYYISCFFFNVCPRLILFFELLGQALKGQIVPSSQYFIHFWLQVFFSELYSNHKYRFKFPTRPSKISRVEVLRVTI